MISVGLFALIMFLPGKLRINLVIFIIIFSYNVSSILPTQLSFTAFRKDILKKST